MRLPILILLIANSMTGFCQEKKSPVPMVDGKVIYSEIVSIENNTKDILYGKSKLWFADTFKSSKDVIQLDDKEM